MKFQIMSLVAALVLSRLIPKADDKNPLLGLLALLLICNVVFLVWSAK